MTELPPESHSDLDERLTEVEKALEALFEADSQTQNPSAWTALHEDPERREAFLRLIRLRWQWIVDTYIEPRATGSKGGSAAVTGHRWRIVAEAECWEDHRAVVEEVGALVASWAEAYHRNSRPTSDPINWHDRWLGPCIDRIAEYGIHECTKRRACQITEKPYRQPETDAEEAT